MPNTDPELKYSKRVAPEQLMNKIASLPPIQLSRIFQCARKSGINCTDQLARYLGIFGARSNALAIEKEYLYLLISTGAHVKA